MGCGRCDRQVGQPRLVGNAFVFADVQWLFPTFAMPWGPMGSLFYFVVIVAAVFGAATVVVGTRDA